MSLFTSLVVASLAGQAASPAGEAAVKAATDETRIGGGTSDAADADQDRVAAEKELVEVDDYVVKLSLPTELDFKTWRSPGLRVQLGYGYGRQYANAAGVPLSTHQISFRPHVRLSEIWSLAIAASYKIALGGFTGMQWSLTVEPTVHPIDGLGISVGIGYGGLIGERRPYEDVTYGPTDATFSRSAGPNERLQSCDGSGGAGLVRVEYLFVVGPLFASGPYVQGDVQATRCTEGRMGLNIETGESTAVSQWWLYRGWNAGWWLTWR